MVINYEKKRGLVMNSEPHGQSAHLEGRIWTRDFVFVCLANFFVFLGFQMTLPTLPLFLKELGGNDQLVGLIVGIFTFSALLLRPYAGHALESKGRGFVYKTGLVVFVLRSEEHTSELQSRF